MTATELVNIKGLQVLRRARVSAYVAGTTTIGSEELIKMYANKTEIRMYKHNPEILLTMSVISNSLGRLESNSSDASWNALVENIGAAGIKHIYNILRERIKRSELAQANITTTPQGKFVLATIGIESSTGMAFPSHEFEGTSLGTVEGLTKFYTKLIALPAMFAMVDKRAHLVWPSTAEVVVALLGLPYTLSMRKGAYCTDFWYTLLWKAPTVFESFIKDAASRDRTYELRRDLGKHPSIHLVS